VSLITIHLVIIFLSVACTFFY